MKFTFGLKFFFFAGFILTLTGALFTVQTLPGASAIIWGGLGLSIIFMLQALSEIYTTEKLAVSEKIMWSIGILMTSGFAGLLYVTSLRPKLVRA
ncbi:hypothetical protein I5M27_03025 [Adhaeribacter sp. BT258]|uniref:Uncharacterized protein n=1 Tax=Adhaeribacter terrigena TaxID=2793070 RepID=A0ABS1BXR7_9BACT|nr:hypothetical protein [Adhaeribacter terrigena]MBK0401941.1 hypothetical protein [Adhaeribacter terrigena]